MPKHDHLDEHTPSDRPAPQPAPLARALWRPIKRAAASRPGRHLKAPVARLVLALLGAGSLVLSGAAAASAGTYPMYQCGGPTQALAPGWSAWGADTIAVTQLFNTCGSAGSIGTYVESNGVPGNVTTSTTMGSHVVLSVTVPAGYPDVTIANFAAHTIVSPNTGDDAFLGYDSANQVLPGMVELPFATSTTYRSDGSWALPQGARNFDVFVNCSTDKSSPTCNFPQSTLVPALKNIVMTLAESVAPAIGSASGTLASAASSGATVSGTQTLAFGASDADSGVRSATLTLAPQTAGQLTPPLTQTLTYSCAYDSWNACPQQQSGSLFNVDTTRLPDGAYNLTLAVQDAAGNVAHRALGALSTHNAPSITSVPTITGSPVVGQSLTATMASTSSPAGAGSVTNSGQWLRCSSTGSNCQPISGSTGTTYNLVAQDAGTSIRFLQTARDNDGATSAQSAPLGPVSSPTQSTSGSSGAGSTGAGGTGGPGGAGGSTTLTLTLTPGGTLGALQGSRTPWRISLLVTPRRVHRATRIRLTGTVASSPRPRQGKLIYLQARTLRNVWRGRGRRRHRVRAYGPWVTFRALRTHANGRFAASYRFKLGGRHTYQFKAVAPKEGGFENPTGHSPYVTVSET